MVVFSMMPLGLIAEKPPVLAGAAFESWELGREIIQEDKRALQAAHARPRTLEEMGF